MNVSEKEADVDYFLLRVFLSEAKVICRSREDYKSRAHTPHQVVGHTCSESATTTYQGRRRLFQNKKEEDGGECAQSPN